jgi:hypothetical protein
MISIYKHRRGFGFVVVASILAACSVDTSDLHFVPDDVLSNAGEVTGAGNNGTGNTGADDAGGAPDNGGSSTGGSSNKAGSTGKAGQATGGTTATAGSPATGGVTNAGGPPVGGAGGMGGMPIGCPNAVANRNEPLIDNFDDGDPGLPMPPLGGRVGGWFVVNDGTMGATQMPPANDPTRPPKPSPPGFDGRGFALFTQGKGFLDWGAGLGMTFSNSGAMKACVYDAAIHTGIRFRATGKITGPDPYLHVHVVTTDVADREHSGTCDALTEKCYDNFNFDVLMPGVGLWQEVVVPFTDLKQAGWGAPKKFYPNHLLNLEFVAGPGAEFEFGIDQVEFY